MRRGQTHSADSASPPAIITAEPGRVNLETYTHIDRPWGLGTGATSKPVLCLFHQLRMNRERKEIETDRGREKSDMTARRGEEIW